MSFSASYFSLSSCTLFSAMSVYPAFNATLMRSGVTVLVAKRSFTSSGLRPTRSQVLVIRCCTKAMFCNIFSIFNYQLLINYIGSFSTSSFGKLPSAFLRKRRRLMRSFRSLPFTE